jgi:hypothetical protein
VPADLDHDVTDAHDPTADAVDDLAVEHAVTQPEGAVRFRRGGAGGEPDPVVLHAADAGRRPTVRARPVTRSDTIGHGPVGTGRAARSRTRPMRVPSA